MTTPASRTDRLFLIVNRLFSLLLLLALLGMLAGALALGYLSLERGPVKEPGMAKAEEKTEAASRHVILGFAQAESIAGANVDLVRLVAEERGLGFSPEYNGKTRNVLFIRGAGQPSHWLFKDHRNVVTSLQQLQDGERREGSPTLALYIEYTTPRPADADAKPVSGLALAKPDGTGMKTVLPDVTRILSHRVTGERQLAVLFQRGTALRQATFSLEDFAVVAGREVVKLPKAI